MIKKQIKELAQKSFNKGVLDEAKVALIAKTLKRKDLKRYIRALKRVENENTVKVSTSFNNELSIPKDVKTDIKNMYPGKKIQYLYDPDLAAGIKIVCNDMYYEYNVKNSLEEILAHIRETL